MSRNLPSVRILMWLVVMVLRIFVLLSTQGAAVFCVTSCEKVSAWKIPCLDKREASMDCNVQESMNCNFNSTSSCKFSLVAGKKTKNKNGLSNLTHKEAGYLISMYQRKNCDVELRQQER